MGFRTRDGMGFGGWGWGVRYTFTRYDIEMHTLSFFDKVNRAMQFVALDPLHLSLHRSHRLVMLSFPG